MPDYGYKEIDYHQRVVIANLVRRFEEIEAYINQEVPEGRRRSLAITKLEEAAMWAAKAVSKPEPNTRGAVETAIDLSKGDKNKPWGGKQGKLIAKWNSVQ